MSSGGALAEGAAPSSQQSFLGSQHHLPTAQQSLLPRLSFTQGLLVGQLSIVLVVVALIRYLLFEDAPIDSREEDGEQDGVERSGSLAKRRHFPKANTASTGRRPFTTASSLLSLSLSSAPPRAKSPPPRQGSLNGGSAGKGPTLATLARIPEAVGYDLETATDIDVGWLNVLVAHLWEGYRDDFLAGGSAKPPTVDSPMDADVGRHSSGMPPGDPYRMGHQARRTDQFDETDEGSLQRSARDLMEEIINRPKVEEGKMDFLDEIRITECLLGDSYPIFSNARVRPRDDQGRVRIELDVDYSDLLSLSIQTAVLINYPKPRFAVLPISLGLRITRFSGTLSVSISSHTPAATPASARSRHSLEVSLHPDFLLLATCSSLVGSRAKLQDIPKIQQLILQRIRQAILDKVGWPRIWTLELPDLVRRRQPRQEKQQQYGDEFDDEEEAFRDEREYMEGIAEEEGLYDDDGNILDEGLRTAAGAPYSRAGPSNYQSGGYGTGGSEYPLMDAQRTPRAKHRAAALSHNEGSSASAHGLSGRDNASQLLRRRNGGPMGASMHMDGRGWGNLAAPSGPSSQYTSISRRQPQPGYNGGGGRPQHMGRSQSHKLPARQRRDGEYENDEMAQPRSSQMPGGLGPAGPGRAIRSGKRGVNNVASQNGATSSGAMPGVEAWRKEMVRKTHGGSPGPGT